MPKVMMIDDEPETLEIYKCYLQEEHELYPFHTGEEALREIQKIQPAVILLDIEMPYMDGFQVLEYLKSSKEFAKIPVIGVTGQRSKATALKFLGKGATSYLLKPVTKEELLAKVREVYEKDQEQKSKKKILIVDDEVESLLYYKAMLSESYHVMALNSAKSALDYLLQTVPDLIILDYQMPLFNGNKLFQIIRTMNKVKEVPIVFLTGMTEKELLIECAELMPEGVILKSSGKEILLQKIEEVFARYQK